MGPNVKFVSAITGAFSNKKNGGQFFSAKKTKPGGVGGGAVVWTKERPISFWNAGPALDPFGGRRPFISFIHCVRPTTPPPHPPSIL